MEKTMENVERTQDALQLEALLVSRAYLYTLFHKLMGGEPNEQLLASLLDDTAADVIDEFAAGSEELKAFGEFLTELRADEASDLLDRASDEYTRVFVGPAALPASPYESPYTGAHDMSLFQENTLAVRGIYHAHGLRVRREQAVPDDHVAIMCAYMAKLADRALEAFHAGDSAALADLLRDAGSFVEAHLANWVGIFAESVRNSKAGAAAVMYPQILEVFAAFVRADIAFTVEAAYWAQCNSLEPQGLAPELEPACAALEGIAAVRPFGIQDNELVNLD